MDALSWKWIGILLHTSLSDGKSMRGRTVMYMRLGLALAMMGLAIPAPIHGNEAPRSLKEPGVSLTFDDRDVAGWVEAIPIFEKYDARATFFVTRFDQLSDEQVDGLRTLREAGHTIGCHGFRTSRSLWWSRMGRLSWGRSGFLPTAEPSLFPTRDPSTSPGP